MSALAVMTLADVEQAAPETTPSPRVRQLQPSPMAVGARVRWPIGWLSVSALSVIALFLVH